MERPDSTRYYNQNALNYLSRRKLDGAELRASLAPFLNEFKAASRILDVGCGPGLDADIFSQAGHEVVGLEMSPKMVDLAKIRAPHITVILKNALFYTPTAGEWDGVWMNEFLNDLPSEQAQRVVALCFKGIKPGGVLGGVVKEGTGFYEDREDDLAGPSRFVYLYGEKQLCSMIEQTGFKIKGLARRTDKPGLLMFLAQRI